MKKALWLISVLVTMLFAVNSSVCSQRQNFSFPDEVADLAFSPDGRYVAGLVGKTSKPETVYLWEKAGGLIRSYESKLTSVSYTSLAFSPDNQYLVAAGISDLTGTGVTILWQVNTAQRLRIYPYVSGVNDIAYSPDSKYMAFAADNDRVGIYTFESTKVTKVFTGHSKDVYAVVISPDSKYIYSGSKDKEIIQWDYASGQNARTLIGHDDDVTALDISADGSMLCSGCKDGSIFVWDLTSGTIKTRINNHTEPITAVRFSPDARYVISSSEDQTARVFDAESGILQRSYIGHEDEVNSVDISIDGQFIATASDDETIKLWNSNIRVQGGTVQNTVDPVPADTRPEDTTPETTPEDNKVEDIPPQPEVVSDPTTKPEVIWVNPLTQSEGTGEAEYPMHVLAASGSKIEKVRIYVNSQLIRYDLSAYEARSGNDYNLDIEYPVSLNPGNNSILIVVTNEAGSTTGEIRTLRYDPSLRQIENAIIWENPDSQTQVVSESVLTISACIQSDQKITKVTLYLNDELWDLERTGHLEQEDADCRINYLKQVNLQDGNNKITIEATTADNQQIESTRNIRYVAISGAPR